MKVIIKKSKRKTISVRIIDGNTVLVNAPLYADNDYINKLLSEKSDWISKNLDKIKGDNNRNNSVLNYKKAYLYGSLIDYTANYKQILYAEANDYLPKRIQFLADTLGFKYNGLIIKNFKSKWGSCNSKRIISLNVKLVALDKSVIDYVIVHELCHTVYMNHKKDFHKRLSSYFKNEKDLKSKLKDYGFITKIQY